MKRILLPVILVVAVTLLPCLALSDESAYPDYLRKAQTLLDKASFKASELDSFADEVLIARNFMRNAEAEFKNNVGGWSGKLDPKAEPTVRYLAAMAQLQAQIVISRAEKLAQEKERTRLEGLVVETKSRIKVFDDKNAELADLRKQLAASKTEAEQLTAKMAALTADLSAKSATGSSAEQKVSALTAELQTVKQSLAASEQKGTALDAELKQVKAALATVTAQKGAVESQSKEQVEALKFNEAVGKLGGVMKATADGTTVIFARMPLFKTTGKTTVLSPDGVKNAANILDILKGFPEYRVVIKVHGFGTPTKNEDAAATDYMARLLREELVVKGKADPTAVEAIGAGTSSPLFAKGNPDGNRRVEVTFVKK